MVNYIIRRLLISIPVIFLIILVTFLLVQDMPGGPFDAIGQRAMPEHIREIMENRYGLNESVSVQFFNYLGNLLQGDLGPMMRLRSQSVNDIVKDSFPVSIQLGALSLILGFTIGLPAGIIAALRHNTLITNGASYLFAEISILSNVHCYLSKYIE